MVEQEPVTVFIAQGELEEDQIRAFLAAHGIRTSVRGEALRRLRIPTDEVIDHVAARARRAPHEPDLAIMDEQVGELLARVRLDLPVPAPVLTPAER